MKKLILLLLALTLALTACEGKTTTTVTATETIINPATGKGRRFIYSGKTGVLNGVPYSISVDW